MKLYSIKFPNQYFVIKAENEIVVKAPDLAAWSIGKKIENVIDFYKQKGAAVTII